MVMSAAAVASVLPSSTATTSYRTARPARTGRNRAANSASTASSLYTGTTTEITAGSPHETGQDRTIRVTRLAGRGYVTPRNGRHRAQRRTHRGGLLSSQDP